MKNKKILKKTLQYWNQYWNQLYNYFKKKLDSDIVEDILQETYLTLYQKLKFMDCTDDKKIKSWLYRTARFKVKNYLKKESQNYNDEYSFDDEVDERDNFEKEITIRDLIKNAFLNSGMTEIQKQISELIIFKKCTIKNVSKILEITERQVRYNYSEGLYKIRLYLEKSGIGLENLE